MQRTALMLLEYSVFEYVIISPKNLPNISEQYLEFFSAKLTQEKPLRMRFKEEIIKIISQCEDKKLDFYKYYIHNIQIEGKGYNVIILNLFNFGKSFGYPAIQTSFKNPFLKEEIDLFTKLAGDMSFAINYSLVEIEKAKIKKELREKARFYYTLIQNLPSFVYRSRNDKSWTMEYLSSFMKSPVTCPKKLLGINTFLLTF